VEIAGVEEGVETHSHSLILTTTSTIASSTLLTTLFVAL
jgi:hypothetical protein